MIISVFSASLFNVAAAENDILSFELNSDGLSYCVSDCNNDYVGEVVIPSEFEGKPVTCIAPYAFYESQITSVIIPESVTLIDYSAFEYSYSLTNVSIPERIETIGFNAFYGCNSLSDIVLPDKYIKINYSCFDETGIYYDSSNWINGCFCVGNYLISCNYSSSDDIVVPEGIKYIAEAAFIDNNDIISVTLPQGLLSIGSQAFLGCWSLETINIPESVNYVGSNAFYDTAIFNKIYSIHDSVFYVDSVLVCADPTSVLGSVVVKEGTTVIADDAFNGCTGLKSIELPNSVTSIGNGAFVNCYNLETLVIPETVLFLGSGLFAGCSSLKSVVLPSSTTSLIDYRYFDYYFEEYITVGFFEGCSSLKSLEIPSNVIEIQPYTFKNCSALENVTVASDNPCFTSVEGVLYSKDITELVHFPKSSTISTFTLPETITNIKENAFSDCSNLSSVILPKGLTTIGSCAFSCCPSLVAVNIPETVTFLGDYAFSDCGSLQTVNMPDSVEYLGKYCFSGCTSLNQAVISKALTEISEYAFYGCTSLESIELHQGIINIGQYAFSDCVAFTSVVLPDGVVSIGDGAFAYCYNLTRVNLPESVKTIGSNAFSDSGLTNVVIPANVERVGSYALYNTPYYCNASNWTNGVLYSGNCLIAADNSVSSDYTVKNNTTLIADYAFWGCSSIADIVIPGSVVNIGECAFMLCDNLVTAKIGSGVTNIGDDAFSSCASLQIINVDSSNIAYKSKSGVLFNKDMTVIIKYPANGKAEYEIPATVISIADKAFSHCTKLTDVTIPEGVKDIGVSAFSDCLGLTYVKIPDSVETIGVSAFEYCENLTYVWLGKGIKTIGNYAFYMCDNLWEGYYNSSEMNFYFNVEIGEGNDSLEWAYFEFNEKPEVPKLKSVKNTVNGVKITWAEVETASSYRVYRKKSGGSWSLLNSCVYDTTFVDTTAKSGVKYSYKVRAENYQGLSPKDDNCLTIRYLSAPKISRLANVNSGVKITWNKVSGAKEYKVYRGSSNGSWKLIKTVEGTSCIDTGIKNQSGKVYKYYVKAVSGDYISGYNGGSAAPKIERLSTPDVLSAKSYKSGIQVKWDDVKGADGYYVYRKTTGGWSRIAKVSGANKCKFTDSKAEKGTTYTYTVKAYSGKYTSGYEAGVKCKDKY